MKYIVNSEIILCIEIMLYSLLISHDLLVHIIPVDDLAGQRAISSIKKAFA